MHSLEKFLGSNFYQPVNQPASTSKRSLSSQFYGLFFGTKITPAPSEIYGTSFDDNIRTSGDQFEIPEFTFPSQNEKPTFISWAGRKILQLRGKGYYSSDFEAFKQHLVDHVGEEITDQVLSRNVNFEKAMRENGPSEQGDSVTLQEDPSILIRAAAALKNQNIAAVKNIGLDYESAQKLAQTATAKAARCDQITRTLEEKFPNRATEINIARTAVNAAQQAAAEAQNQFGELKKIVFSHSFSSADRTEDLESKQIQVKETLESLKGLNLGISVHLATAAKAHKQAIANNRIEKENEAAAALERQNNDLSTSITANYKSAQTEAQAATEEAAKSDQIATTLESTFPKKPETKTARDAANAARDDIAKAQEQLESLKKIATSFSNVDTLQSKSSQTQRILESLKKLNSGISTHLTTARRAQEQAIANSKIEEESLRDKITTIVGSVSSERSLMQNIGADYEVAKTILQTALESATKSDQIATELEKTFSGNPETQRARTAANAARDAAVEVKKQVDSLKKIANSFSSADNLLNLQLKSSQTKEILDLLNRQTHVIGLSLGTATSAREQAINNREIEEALPLLTNRKQQLETELNNLNLIVAPREKISSRIKNISILLKSINKDLARIERNIANGSSAL